MNCVQGLLVHREGFIGMQFEFDLNVIHFLENVINSLSTRVDIAYIAL